MKAICYVSVILKQIPVIWLRIWYIIGFSFYSSPLSSMVFGTNALFTKPAQSLAPMMVLSILNQFGYERLKDAGKDASPRYGQNQISVIWTWCCNCIYLQIVILCNLLYFFIDCTEWPLLAPLNLKKKHQHVRGKYIFLIVEMWFVLLNNFQYGVWLLNWKLIHP